jgi:hypothetical protein
VDNKKILEIREKNRIKKENETKTFLDDINKLHINKNITLQSANIKKELKECYISYNITKYPYCNKYTITRYKKDYPFNIYNTKEFLSINDIPKKYQIEFKRLELNFY